MFHQCLFGQTKNDCNVSFDESKIFFNSNLDFFLKKLKSDTFKVSYSREKIPDFIKLKFLCLIDTIASANEPWQVTDNISDENLPRRRLRFSAINKKQDIFVVVYEKGGIGKITNIMMMKLTDNGVQLNGQKNVEDIWVGQGCFTGETITQLLIFLEENKYFNQLHGDSVYY